jgi:hypothetical protein
MIRLQACLPRNAVHFSAGNEFSFIIITIIIIIIIIITISFMQGIYTYILETNHVPEEYNVAAILSLLFMVPISLAPALALIYFYISTFRSIIIIIIIIIIIKLPDRPWRVHPASYFRGAGCCFSGVQRLGCQDDHTSVQ